LQHSWTRWRRRRLERRLDREQAWLAELERLTVNQLVTVQRLEQELYPPQVVSPPVLEPSPPRAPRRPEPPPLPTFNELMEQAAEEQVPMPDPRLEIAQRLGLPPLQSSSPSSPS
jgi:hypothetical protein